ncbi:MAG: Holliday junction resolvase RuvX [Bacteroidetes bacterium]|jgi:putative Holliday junction resolvase|nr:Holliday junction resolvase RuvX [Chitinophagia bacterium]NBV36167.1 Holliday junction resolvase RuvX [Bacteroidota bacterium]
MGRIMGIDYGSKRTGLAVTDPLKMIAQPLEMVYTVDLKMYLDSYLYDEDVESFVVGLPTNLNGTDTDATQPVKQFIEALKSTYPEIPVFTIDERLTSHEAQQSIIASGAKKSQRANKGLIDAVSAAIILQTYLQKIS